MLETIRQDAVDIIDAEKPHDYHYNKNKKITKEGQRRCTMMARPTFPGFQVYRVRDDIFQLHSINGVSTGQQRLARSSENAKDA